MRAPNPGRAPRSPSRFAWPFGMRSQHSHSFLRRPGFCTGFLPPIWSRRTSASSRTISTTCGSCCRLHHLVCSLPSMAWSPRRPMNNSPNSTFVFSTRMPKPSLKHRGCRGSCLRLPPPNLRRLPREPKSVVNGCHAPAGSFKYWRRVPATLRAGRSVISRLQWTATTRSTSLRAIANGSGWF